MRGKFPWRFAASLLLAGLISGPLSAEGQDFSGILSVSGGLERGSGRPAYRLEISAESDSVLSGQALLVYAEPSHTLLLAHADPAYRGPEGFGEALALTKGATRAFRHSVTLPYHPLTDRRLVVVLQMADGQEQVVADALVNLRRFDFTTLVTFWGESTAAKYNHCCRGGSCDRICIECETASFTCNLINCDIQCGHDLTWPPKV